MKLVVGLGNPGNKYALTRHNLGFMLIDKFASAHNKNFTKEKFQALCAELTLRDEKIILLKPQTFMNNSGESVRKAVKFYKISGLDIIVLYDDLDQDFGAVRFREKGSSGGHNGIKSIIACLGHENFARVKIGIGKPAKEETIDYVLGKFSAEEQKKLPEILDQGLGLLNKWLARF